MTNVNVSVKGNDLTVSANLAQDLGPSASGKTILVASSKGGVEIAGKPGYFLNVTVYKKAPVAKAA